MASLFAFDFPATVKPDQAIALIGQLDPSALTVQVRTSAEGCRVIVSSSTQTPALKEKLPEQVSLKKFKEEDLYKTDSV